MNIGLTGKNASGKGEVAKILSDMGYDCFSLSDAIREELRNENKETSRDNMINKGNELRKTFGPGVLGMKIRNLIKSKNNVIDSIRNPIEIDELRKLDNFILFGVDAPIELRYERIKLRDRKGDVQSLEELKIAEEKENLSESNNQQLDNCLKKADINIINDGSIISLKEKVLKIIGDFEEK